jgi:hypothetical protein
MPSTSSRNRVWGASVLACVIGAVAAVPAWGAEPRVRPVADDDNDVPAAAPAQRNGQGLAAAEADGDAAADARRRRVNNDDWFRDRAYRDGYARYGAGSVNGEFPSAEVGDFVLANARAATARMMFRRAESALSAAVRDARREFEASAELKQALADEKAAHDAFDKARRDALAQVVASAKYRAILSLHEDLGRQIVAHRRGLQSPGRQDVYPVIASPADPAAAALFTAAELRMQVAGDARAMEREAIEASDDLRAARSRLTAAARKVSELRQGFDSALREDPDLLAARRALEDARISRVTAAAYLRGSRLAAEEAVNFAYFLHRYDSQVAFDPYAGYGYGSRYRSVRYQGRNESIND